MGELSNNKTFLITGATGFLGSHLAKRFFKKKYKVIILKRSFSDIWRIKEIFNDLIYYDVDKIDNLNKIFKENKIDFIIHTATNYGRNKESINEVLYSNLVFPLELIQIGIDFNVKNFINTDTFTKSNYERLQYYSLSKKQFLEWLKLIDKNIKVFNLILEHVFGEADSNDKFIPFVINKILSNATEMDFTKGEQKRDFIYIHDVVDAYEKVVEQEGNLNGNYYDFEIGTGKATSIKKIVKIINDLLDNDREIKFNFGALPYARNEVMRVVANYHCTYKKIEWKASTLLEDGLKNTIEWYRKNIKHMK